MVWDTATAHFSLSDDNLILNYYPTAVDTSLWSELRKQGITLMEHEHSKLGKSAPFGLTLHNRKLFLIEGDGQLVKTKMNSKGKSKRYFLSKID